MVSFPFFRLNVGFGFEQLHHFVRRKFCENDDVTVKATIFFRYDEIAMMKWYRIGDDFELRNICNVMLRNDIQKHLWSIDRSIFGSIGEYLIGIIN